MTSLSTLTPELLFAIYSHLDRTSLLSLSLTSPQYLRSLTIYFDLETLRANELFIERFGIPDDVSFTSSDAFPALIRYLTMPFEDDFKEHPSIRALRLKMKRENRNAEGNEQKGGDGDRGGVNRYTNGVLSGPVCDAEDSGKLYHDSNVGREEQAVQDVLAAWLKARCNVQEEVVFCAECYRYMRITVVGEIDETDLWVQHEMKSALWVRLCGRCADIYGLDRQGEVERLARFMIDMGLVAPAEEELEDNHGNEGGKI